MTPEQIQNYIRSELAKGVFIGAIKVSLRRQGAEEEQITAAIDVVDPQKKTDIKLKNVPLPIKLHPVFLPILGIFMAISIPLFAFLYFQYRQLRPAIEENQSLSISVLPLYLQTIISGYEYGQFNSIHFRYPNQWSITKSKLQDNQVVTLKRSANGVDGVNATMVITSNKESCTDYFKTLQNAYGYLHGIVRSGTFSANNVSGEYLKVTQPVENSLIKIIDFCFLKGNLSYDVKLVEDSSSVSFVHLKDATILVDSID